MYLYRCTQHEFIKEHIMPQNESDVIILKPTSAFLTFLGAQFPDLEVPDKAAVHRDTTAYTLKKQDTDLLMLDEIERHFPQMFRHEVRRILGDNIPHDLDVSFLDFLCCFKFELHSQVVLMESEVDLGQHVLCVKPRSLLLNRMKTYASDSSELTAVLEKINLNQLTDNATVVIKNFSKWPDVQPFVNHYYRALFKAEMFRLSDYTEQWPDVDSCQEFNRYFSVELHTQLVHLH